MFRSKTALTLLLAAVIVAALVNGALDRSQIGRPLSPEVGFRVAMLMHDLGHPQSVDAIGTPDPVNRLEAYCYTFAYFVLFPVLWIGVAVSLALRKDVDGYRVLCLAVVVDYLLTALVGLVMPTSDQWGSSRWSEVLAGLWPAGFLQLTAPIKGLDHGFPFSHVSLMVVAILVCCVFQPSLRTSVLALGMTVILACFFLGIYWVPFIAVGMALGWVSVLIAQSLPSLAEPSTAT